MHHLNDETDFSRCRSVWSWQFCNVIIIAVCWCWTHACVSSEFLIWKTLLCTWLMMKAAHLMTLQQILLLNSEHQMTASFYGIWRPSSWTVFFVCSRNEPILRPILPITFPPCDSVSLSANSIRKSWSLSHAFLLTLLAPSGIHVTTMFDLLFGIHVILKG